MGCFACIVACKDWHDVPAGPVSWIRIKTIEKGRYPDLSVSFLPQLCVHCASPACAAVCPADAITKRGEDGVVVVDSEACLGSTCGLCLDECPYGAPQFGAEEDAKMQKCDLCIERISIGKKPICVSSCPMYALDAGPLDELWAKYGKCREIEGFEYSENVIPSIVFTPRKNSGNSRIRKIEIAPSVKTATSG